MKTANACWQQKVLHYPPPVSGANTKGLFEYFLRNGTGVFVNGDIRMKVVRKRILGISFYKIKVFSLLDSGREMFLIRLFRRHV